MTTSVIATLNNMGLVEKLNGDDSKLENIQQASTVLVNNLKSDRSLLIPYVLAGLNANIDSQNIAINASEQALLSIWKTANSYYGSEKPINTYRIMLLDACNQMVNIDKSNAYILWNTVADIYPYLKFGSEKTYIEEMLHYWLEISEKFVLEYIEDKQFDEIDLIAKTKKKVFPNFTFDKNDFQKKLFLAMGSVDIEGVSFSAEQAFNPHNPSQGAPWIKEFINKFSKIYENHIEGLTKTANEVYAQATQIASEKEAEYNRNYEKLLGNHQKVISKIKLQNNLKFESLWWSQTMYSPTQKESYRHMDVNIANLVMVEDLLRFVDVVAPDSFSYLLLEVNAKLLTEEQSHKMSLLEFFEHFKKINEAVPESIKVKNFDEPVNNVLNISDVIGLAISDNPIKVNEIEKQLISSEIRMTLPQLAQALFRQKLVKKFISTES